MEVDQLDMTPKRGEKAELEVTGVSRSGRVRKKSSKLMDFESLDEPKIKKPKSSPDSPKKRPSLPPQQKIQFIKFTLPPNATTNSIDLQSLLEAKNLSINHLGQKITFVKNQTPIAPENSVNSQTSLTSSETEEDTLSSKENAQILELLNSTEEDIDEDEGNLVINEKSLKKKAKCPNKRKKPAFSKDLVKNDNVVTSTPKPVRYTAYMLWSKDMRQQLLKINPRMDFSAISKKLGELWAKVPSNERYNWSNRAKRETEKCLLALPKGVVFDDKKTKKRSSTKSLRLNSKTPIVELAHLLVTSKKCSANQTDEEVMKDLEKDNNFREIKMEPIDVGAHLTLLGESLELIGDRLKEHSGQIAVSGSLSVLLDSLLCALGSLGCLTLQIPGLGDQNPEVMKRTLENIAYIMPGL